MQENPANCPCREFLIGLVNAIEKANGLEEQSKALLQNLLGNWGKALKFNNWAKGRMVNGKLQATEAEICAAAVQIAKECDCE